MTKNQKLDTKSNTFAHSLSLPFEYSKVIGQNLNFVNIVINFLITITRFLMGAFVIKNLAEAFYSGYKEYKKCGYDISCNVPLLYSIAFFKYISICCEIVVNIIIALDCTGFSYYLITYRDYKAEMEMQKIARMAGLNVHLFRYLLWAISIYSREFSLAPLSSFIKAGDPKNLTKAKMLLEYLYIPAAASYIVAVIIKYWGTFIGNRYEVSNPWIEDWEYPAEFNRAKEKNISSLKLAFFILNITIYLVLISFFVDFKLSENHFHIDWADALNSVVPISALLMAVSNIVFRIFRRMDDSKISSAFNTNYMFMAFFYLQTLIEMRENTFSKELYDIYYPRFIYVVTTLAIIFIINAIIFVFTNTLSLINMFLWTIKWTLSLEGVAAILQSAGAITIGLGAVYGSYALVHEYFYVDLEINKIFLGLIKMMLVVFEIILGLVSVLKTIAALLNNVGFQIACVILCSLTLIAIPIASAIGFGVASPIIGLEKVVDILTSMVDVLAKIAALKPMFENVGKFAAKGKKLQSVVDNSHKTKLAETTFIHICSKFVSGFVPFIGLLALYFYSAERQSEVPRPLLAVIIISLLLVFGIFFVFITIFEILVSRSYDLVLFVMKFRPGDGIKWSKIGIITISAGLIFSLAAYIFGMTSGFVKNDEYTIGKNVEKFVFPGLPAICCPLMSTKGARKDTNSFLVICNRISCCCLEKDLNEIEEGNNSANVMRKICCPVYRDEEGLKFCRCFKNFSELRKEKAMLDNSIDPSVILTKQKSEKDYDYSDLYLLKKDQEIELNTKLNSKQNTLLQSAPENAEKSYSKLYSEGSNAKSFKQSLAIVKSIKTILKNPFKTFVQYLGPILIAGGIGGYLIIKALNSRWASLSFEADGMLSSVLKDTSVMANKGHVDESEKSKKMTCPLLDLVKVLMGVIKKLLGGILGGIFPKFAELLSKLKSVIVLFTDNKDNDIFPSIVRFLVLSPAMIFIVCLVVFSLFSSLVKPFNRIMFQPVLVFFLMAFMSFLAIPEMARDLFNSLPFFSAKITLEKGYQYAKQVYIVLFVSLVFLLVDHFMPIVVPKREDKEAYVELYDREMDNALMFG